MVIWSELRMGQYKDDDHRQDAHNFILLLQIMIAKNLSVEFQYSTVSSLRRCSQQRLEYL